MKKKIKKTNGTTRTREEKQSRLLPCVWLGVGVSWVGLDLSLWLFGWNPRWVELAREGIFMWDVGWLRLLKSGGRSEPPFLRRERRDRPARPQAELARGRGSRAQRRWPVRTCGGAHARGGRGSPARRSSPASALYRTEIKDKGHQRNIVSISGPLYKSAMIHRFYRSDLV